MSAGAVDYLFTLQQLQHGFRVDSIDTPHLTVRVLLFGHQFKRFIFVQGSYMRPVKYVSYRDVNVDRLDSATFRNSDATETGRAIAASGGKFFGMNGEPPRNRTENPQIKSLLLCQLS